MPYFSQLRQHLHAALEEATYDIRVAVAWFTDRETADLIRRKALAGVKIRIFIVADAINERLDMLPLVQAGVQIHRVATEQGLLHYKFCIIDRKVVVYGSANWTYSAFSANHEQLTVVADDAAFVERFWAMFQQLEEAFTDLETTETGVQVHPERAALRQEVHLLETLLAETETKLAEVESVLGRFQRLYQYHLGSLLREVLRLRAKRAELKARLTQKAEDQQNAQQHQTEYSQFVQPDAPEPAHRLPEPEVQKNIHQWFREAVKLCHPDKVKAEFRTAAQAVFVKLKTAFDAQDADAVKQILEDLKKGIAWQVAPEQITDVETLRRLRDKLRRQLDDKQQTLRDLLQNSSYHEIAAAQDWEALIEAQRPGLEHQREQLRQEIKALGAESG